MYLNIQTLEHRGVAIRWYMESTEVSHGDNPKCISILVLWQRNLAMACRHTSPMKLCSSISVPFLNELQQWSHEATAFPFHMVIQRCSIAPFYLRLSLHWTPFLSDNMSDSYSQLCVWQLYVDLIYVSLKWKEMGLLVTKACCKMLF